ncbi:hypothetical protein CHUAL_004254 [Chamberlinius hualienensis]
MISNRLKHPLLRSIHIYHFDRRKNLHLIRRSIYSLTGKLSDELSLETKKSIEKHWKEECLRQLQVKDTVESKTQQKCYVLSMFPYPSGNLHMGHVRVYTISDAIARFYHMRGFKVIHPMGWDAFGLPAENAAIERDIHPEVWTKQNISNMKQQLEELRCCFDWNTELATCDPEYYRWTQYLFLKLFENGLAYQKEAYVNWDPKDQTVLADEQVDENGRSWRSGAKIEKKLLKQWFLKTTQFSKALSDGLSDPMLEDWRDIISIQKHWIGDCNGTWFTFKLENSETNSINVWTKNPEAIFGAAFIAIAPHNPISFQHNSCDEDHKLDVTAIHPFTNQPIPVFISKDYTYFNGTDAHLGLPAVSEQDHDFAKQHQLPFNHIFTEDGQKLINSHEYSDLDVEEAKVRICSHAQKMKVGGYFSSSKLRDWLISRQRFWGTPIPIIYCSNCGRVPVPYKDLPVELPKDSTRLGNRMKPLSHFNDWLNTNCPKCDKPALRETDTMDTFVDSSWYFLRYLDSHNTTEPFNKTVIDQNMPVDIYIGGKEHATMHLYYARFMSYFLNKLGMTEIREPFKRLLVQGMVLGQTFISKDSGRYLKPEEVEFIDDKYIEKETNLPVITQFEKMSKSRYNGVDPKEVFDKYGIDSTRLLMLANFAPTSDRDWPADTFPGVLAWQERLWLTVRDFIQSRTTELKKEITESEFKEHEDDLFESRNNYLNHVTHNFHTTFQLSVAISNLQGLTKKLRRMPPPILRNSLQYERTLGSLIISLAPITPHFASEMWSAFTSNAAKYSNEFDWSKNVLEQKWPMLDKSYKLELIARINDIEIHSIRLPQNELNLLTKTKAFEILSKEKAVNKYLNDKCYYQFALYPGFQALVNFNVKGLKQKKKDIKQKN